jgi:hypothetical protein
MDKSMDTVSMFFCETFNDLCIKRSMSIKKVFLPNIEKLKEKMKDDIFRKRAIEADILIGPADSIEYVQALKKSLDK